MKVLVVNKFLFNRGGSETYIFKLFDYMKRAGHEVEFFGMDSPDNIVGNSVGQYTKKIDFKGNMIKKAAYPFRIIYSSDARRKIGRVIENFKPDIVHLNNYNYEITPSIIYEIKRHKLPIVQTIHDTQLVCPYHRLYNYKKQSNCQLCSNGRFSRCVRERCIDNSYLKSLAGAAESYIYHSLGTYNLIDLFVTPSDFIKYKMLEMKVGLPEEKLITLQNFTYGGLSEYNANKKPYVLYFGRLTAEKGIMTLIKACKYLPQIKFIFVGSGELENNLYDLENVDYLGFKSGDELQELISNAMFSVCPSEIFENCPMSVLESQMYGTPVIGANIGGIPELICDGADGLLFEPGNTEDLIEKIRFLYEDELRCKEYSLQCLAKAKKYSIESYYRRLMGVYSRATGKYIEKGSITI